MRIDAPVIRAPIMQYAMLRSGLYTVEGLFVPFIDLLINRRRPRLLTDDPAMFAQSRRELASLLSRDVSNILEGVYPLRVLQPESPLRHAWRIPQLFREGLQITRRRREHKAHEFNEEARELARQMPDYYQRNFHFQGDGYLSERSARLYEHQVEVLFAGAADAMRRLIIRPMKEHFRGTGNNASDDAGSDGSRFSGFNSDGSNSDRSNSDGAGLTFVEFGAGTGAATRFVRLAFPKAKIIAVDLSGPYLKAAQEKLRSFVRHDYLEADAADLPLKDQCADAVYSVFLFHELPLEVRREVMRSAARLLKPGGFFGNVDSLQLGDRPEFDGALKQFPVDFHEPFYANYIRTPLAELMQESGFSQIQGDQGFFSKVCWGEKARGSAGGRAARRPTRSKSPRS